jgi:uncharacterized membrane protein YesL
LWALFSLAGAGLLGVGPATVALAALTRKWTQGQADQARPWNVFWNSYRHDFWRTNSLAWSSLIVLAFLAIDTHATLVSNLRDVHLLIYPLTAIDSFMVAIIIYLFPLYADRHMDSMWKYWRFAALTCILNPGRTLLMLVMLYLAFFVFGGILPFLSLSILMYGLVRFSLAAFSRLENVAQSQNTTTHLTG